MSDFYFPLEIVFYFVSFYFTLSITSMGYFFASKKSNIAHYD